MLHAFRNDSAWVFLSGLLLFSQWFCSAANDLQKVSVLLGTLACQGPPTLPLFGTQGSRSWYIPHLLVALDMAMWGQEILLPFRRWFACNDFYEIYIWSSDIFGLRPQLLKTLQSHKGEMGGLVINIDDFWTTALVPSPPPPHQECDED